MRSALHAGIFLISFSLLFLEITATRVFASILGDEWLLYTVPLAMLGIGVAGSVSVLTSPIRNRIGLSNRAMYVCGGAALATFLLFLATALSSAYSNAQLDAVPGSADNFEFYRAAFRLGLGLMCVVGAFMGLSYFFHGFVINQLFRNVDRSEIHSLYAADLIGAFAGAVVAVISLEFGGFWLPLGIAITTPILAAAAFASAESPRRATLLVGAAAVLMGILAIPSVTAILGPTPHLRSMARITGVNTDLARYDSVTEFAHWWTSYGLISAIEMHREDGNRQTVMVHGAGEGHARVVAYGDSAIPDPSRVWYGAELAVAGCQPGRVLVLLVGPGTEMVLIDRITQGKADITGVELMAKVVEWPIEQERFRLKEFFAKPNQRLVVAEGREFLARDRTKYDCILLSWSGTSRSYYTGMVAALPDNLYTKESIEKLLDHLTPNGQLTLFNVNRLRLMLTTHDILKTKGNVKIPESFVVLDNVDPWDTQSATKLLIKPSGFTQPEVARISEISKEARWDVLYEPFMDRSSPPYADSAFWYDAIHSATPGEFVAPIALANGVQVEPSTDDKPFVYDVLPPTAIFSSWFWFSDRPDTKMSEGVIQSWKAKRRNLIFVGLFSVASAVMILAPLYFRRRTEGWRPPDLARNMIYFASLGAGFMLIEMGIIQKLRLLVGHPGYTLATVLAGIVFFAGIGSLASGKLFNSGILTLRRAAFLALLTSVLCVIGFDALSPVLLALPRVAKMALAFLLPAIPAFFMGQLYPQGLAILPKVEGEIPLHMSVNAVTGTIAGGLGVTLAQLAGYNGVIFIGAAFYFVAGMISGPGPVTEPSRQAVMSEAH